MDSDSDDSYDYLSCLKSGFTDTKYLKKASVAAINRLETNSDTYDCDSDDCIIVEYVDHKNRTATDQSVDKCKDNSTSEKRSLEVPDQLIEEECSGEPEPRGTEPKISDRIVKHLKLELESKPLTSVKNESVDLKPDIKPFKAPDSDIKPFVLKIEDKVKAEESPQLNESHNTCHSETAQTNGQSIDLVDLDSNDLEETNESVASDSSTVSADEGFCALLSSIERVRSQRQRPTFGRILVAYRKRADVKHVSEPKSALTLLISDAIQKGLIEKIEGKDESDAAYRPLNETRKRWKSNESTKNDSSKYSPFSSENQISHESEDCSVDSDFHKNAIPSNLESLAIDGYTDISDIDVSSAQTLFGDTELDPGIFDLYKLVIKKSSPTSLLLSSTPIRSFNHTRNKEVIRKQPISPTTSSTTDDIDEVLSLKDYRNWLLEALPRYSPFIAQKGDRVVYLRDAHKIYIDYELKELLRLYPKFNSTPNEIDSIINGNDYAINAIIIDVKFYQINYMKFSVIQLESQSNVNPIKFNVLYRPNRGICDFLVLEYLYKESQSKNWKSGQQFRSLWKKSWWLGSILSRSVFNRKYPDSLFKCFRIKWNTGEEGYLSPWDLFSIDNNRLPKRPENGVLITREDMLQINYIPSFNEWPELYGIEMERWRVRECKRIYNFIKYIEKNVSTNVVSIFREYPNLDIVYPVTLQLIKERLKNLFYRRKESVIRDIKFLETNAKLVIKTSDFHVAHHFVEVLLCVANDCQSITDEQFFAHLNQYEHLKGPCPQLPAEYQDQDHSYSSKTYNPSPYPMPNRSEPKSPPKKRRKRSAPDTSQLTVCSSDTKATESTQWKLDSQKFIDQLLTKDESMPYRQPVDPVEFPFYNQVIDNPIDLSQIQSKLSSNQYLNPICMRKDFRLMFENAKAFSKNSKSKMRVINKSLSHLAEDRLREIIVDWDRVYAFEQKKLKTNGSKVREPTSRNQLWGYGYQQYY